MTYEILVKIIDDYRLFDLKEEFLKNIKKEFRYLKLKIENEKYKINKIQS